MGSRLFKHGENEDRSLRFFFFSHLSFYFCERVQRRALIQARLEAFAEDLSLDEVIQTQILNAESW